MAKAPIGAISAADRNNEATYLFPRCIVFLQLAPTRMSTDVVGLEWKSPAVLGVSRPSISRVWRPPVGTAILGLGPAPGNRLAYDPLNFSSTALTPSANSCVGAIKLRTKYPSLGKS